MNVEENRLRTFDEWPANAAVDAGRIAKAGFYYTGCGLEVQCFLCSAIVSEWDYGDQAMARHRLVEPTCPFVVNPTGTCNVPLVPPALANGSVESSRSTTSSSSSSGNDSQRSSVIEGNSAAMRELIVRSVNPQRDYRTVAQRLRSFHKWPIPSVVSTEQLATAGFYYLQYGDMVECAFCSGVLTKWKAGDDPDGEHRLHFPSCDFYLRQEAEDDVLQLANVTLMPGATTDLTELGIQVHSTPSNLKNATYEERLRSFVGWPVDNKQTPEMLAAAGFYYTGSDDQVRCAHCDGGLRNWEPKDDVWFEHARWFPTCSFVNLVRGQEFVKHCINNRPPLDPKILGDTPDEDVENVTETSSSSLPTTSRSDIPSITDTVIARLLDTAPALAALEIGLSVDRVKRALKRRMEERGISYTNAEELIEDVLYDQTMEEYTTSSTPDLSPESTNLVDHIILHTTNDSISPLDDTENSNVVQNESNVQPKIKNDENEVCESKPEETETSIKENELEGKKTNSKFDDTALREENRRLKEARLCKICMDNEVAIVFLPCGHLATCVFCAPSLIVCPMCRVKIRANVRTFLS